MREVELCREDGTLNPDAVGWSRFPLHRCNLRGPWGRRKRWDFWCVTSKDVALSITYANLDYLGIVAVSLLDFGTGALRERVAVLPCGAGMHQGERVGDVPIHSDRCGVRLAVEELAEGTRLRAEARLSRRERLTAEVMVMRDAAHESVNVVIPWSERQFQFTSKQNARPASGSVRLGATTHLFSADTGAFGCLDFGRGIWPYTTAWNWASASGIQNGRCVGLQLGGKWTQGTGLTENGICLDGKVSKISEELSFAYDRTDFQRPWRIQSPTTDRVNLDFRPFFLRAQKVELLVARADLHLCFGTFSGSVVADSGERIEIEELVGWAEDFAARW
ncbi:MAG: DUF2804 domain-containing protein [Candidatus Schekmanbacteria bacterium]|nr:DUF2804 domain-containing protein [Candidatus Schekmanbacteria bacterium]